MKIRGRDASPLLFMYKFVKRTKRRHRVRGIRAERGEPAQRGKKARHLVVAHDARQNRGDGLPAREGAVALRLRDIGAFVLKHPHGNRQPPVVFQIRAAVKLLKAIWKKRKAKKQKKEASE